MDKSQAAAIHAYKEQIIYALEWTVDSVLMKFKLHKVITYKEEQTIQQKQSKNSNKVSALLTLLERRDNGWNCLMEYLKENDLQKMAHNLEEFAREHASQNNQIEPPRCIELVRFVEFLFLMKSSSLKSRIQSLHYMSQLHKKTNESELTLIIMRNFSQIEVMECDKTITYFHDIQSCPLPSNSDPVNCVQLLRETFRARGIEVKYQMACDVSKMDKEIIDALENIPMVS